MCKVVKYLLLFMTGGGLKYVLIELLWRGRSHWTMFLLGGICFVYADLQNEWTKWNKPLVLQVLEVDIFITAAEFITGCIVNIWLGWGIWDYSNMPLNLLGQICVPYMVLWLPIALIAIIDSDYLRYWFLGEEKPNYKII